MYLKDELLDQFHVRFRDASKHEKFTALYVNLQQVDSFDVGILIIEDRRKRSQGTSTVLSILQQIRIHRCTLQLELLFNVHR